MSGRTAYDEFLTEWRLQRLATLQPDAFEDLVQSRERELTELAMEHGHRAHLVNAIRPYRSINAYVRALYEQVRHQGEK